MADGITLRVTRYRPDEESEPVFQDYEVPCREARPPCDNWERKHCRETEADGPSPRSPWRSCTNERHTTPPSHEAVPVR